MNMKSTVKNKIIDLKDKTKNQIIKLKDEAKKISLEEYALILFIISRLVTWIFTSVIGTVGIYISMAIYLVIYLAIIIKKIKNKEVDLLLIFLIIVFSLSFLTLLSATNNRFKAEWILSAEHGMVVKLLDPRKGLAALFLILMIKDHKKISKSLKIGALILLPYLLLQVVFYLFTGSWENYYSVKNPEVVYSTYNLPLGYNFVFVFLVLMSEHFKGGKVRYLLLSFIAIFFAIYFGPRGVVVVTAAYFALEFIFNSKKQKDKKIRILKIVLMLTLFVLIGTVGFNYITEHFVPTIDLSSRTMDLLLSGEITSTSGRVKLWSYSLESIKNSPIIGNGIYGDRLYVGNTFRWGYSHNFILEIVSFFGLFGVIIVVYFAVIALRYLISEDYKQYKTLFIILLSSCAKLALSDSFLFLDTFWMLLGFIIMIEMIGKTIKYKKIIIPSLIILILLNLLAFGNYLRVETNRQINKSYIFDKPTVLVTFQGSHKDEYNEIYKKYKKGNRKFTSFISPGILGKKGILTKNMVKEMQKDGWDFQDALYKQDSILSLSKEKMMKNLDKTDKFWKDNKSDLPQALLSYGAAKNYRYMEDIVNRRNLILKRTINANEARYKKISPLNAFDLNAFCPQLTEENYEEICKEMKDSIKNANNKNQVLVFNFSLDLIYEENKDLYNKFIKNVLNELDKYNFKYITADELADKLKIEKDEKRNIIDFIKDLKISDFV